MRYRLLFLFFLFPGLLLFVPPGAGPLALAGDREGLAAFRSRMETAAPGPALARGGLTLYNGVPVAVLVVDPAPKPTHRRILAPDFLTTSAAARATFQVSYVPGGEQDLFGEACHPFPEEAKAAVDQATRIWAGLLQSAVPITVRVCWVNLEGTILGYSGGQPLQRDFSSAPRANTWYQQSLANALAGQDLDPDRYDMHIAMNKNFSWYLGLDANPPANQVDFVTVMLHEIAHGLNFSGTMQYSSSWATASWGWGTGYPNIFDVFMRDDAGHQLINTSIYPNPSSALAKAVTSESLWFYGPRAMAANGDRRVKMYAPESWSPGSSYSHLDYATFSTTGNRLMVFAMSFGDAIHDPGPVTMGLFADLGWPQAALAHTLTVHSSGASAQAITGHPSIYGGTTRYTKTNIPTGTSITLTAPAASGAADFSSWRGCTTTNTPARTCTLTMDSNKTVTAQFGNQSPQLPGMLFLLRDQDPN